jgi:hypothetical protein
LKAHEKEIYLSGDEQETEFPLNIDFPREMFRKVKWKDAEK